MDAELESKIEKLKERIDELEGMHEDIEERYHIAAAMGGALAVLHFLNAWLAIGFGLLVYMYARKYEALRLFSRNAQHDKLDVFED